MGRINNCNMTMVKLNEINLVLVALRFIDQVTSNPTTNRFGRSIMVILLS